MDELQLQRQVYHSQALNGNDCSQVLHPEPIKKFTNLLRPREIVVVRRTFFARFRHETFTVGSDAAADTLAELMSSFATCMADFARHEPLCEHLIEGFPHKVERFAVAYARGFPSREPTPKAHVLLYHMAAQMGLLGGVGLLHEGIVEAAHVRDNEYRRRFVSVIDPCENLRLRFNAYQLHARRTLQSVREPVWDRDMRKRARRSALSRARKSGAFEECEECEE